MTVKISKLWLYAIGYVLGEIAAVYFDNELADMAAASISAVIILLAVITTAEWFTKEIRIK